MDKPPKSDSLPPIEQADYAHVFPPAYMPYEMHPAPHIISAHLHDAGYSTKIIYSNVEALEHVLKSHPDGNSALYWMRKPLTSLSDFEHFVQAKRTMRSILEQKSAGSSEFLTYVHNYLTYQPAYPSTTISGLVQTAQNPKDSIFFDYASNILLPHLAALQPSLVGFTITDRMQASFPMVVASLIKSNPSAFPNTKIAAGGYIISVNKESFFSGKKEAAEFFNYIDFLVHNQGENSLPALLDSLNGLRTMEGVPKLIHMQNGKVIGNSLDSSGLIVPAKFSSASKAYSLKLDYPQEIASILHLPANAKPLSLIINLGCPFRCTFCGIDKTYDGLAVFMDNHKRIASGLEPLSESREISGTSVEQALDVIEKHVRENSVKAVSFSDERLSPQQLLLIARGIKKRGLAISWSAYATVDKEFQDMKFVKELADGGCCFLQFGVETLSRESLLEVKKGQNLPTLSHQSQIFKNLFEAGVMPHVFLMIRLPKQTNADLLSTLSYLSEISENVLTIKPTVAKLTKSSMDAIYPHKAGMEVNAAKVRDLGANLPFDAPGRISPKTAEAWREVFDAYISLFHPYNTVTRELGLSQRLAVGTGKIIKWSKKLSKNKKYHLLDSATSAYYNPEKLHAKALLSLSDSLRKAVSSTLEEVCSASTTPELGSANSKERIQLASILYAAGKATGGNGSLENLMKTLVQNTPLRMQITKAAESLLPGGFASMQPEEKIDYAFSKMIEAGKLLPHVQAEFDDAPQPLFARARNFVKPLAIAASFAAVALAGNFGYNEIQYQNEQKKEAYFKVADMYSEQHSFEHLAIYEYVSKGRRRDEFSLKDAERFASLVSLEFDGKAGAVYEVSDELLDDYQKMQPHKAAYLEKMAGEHRIIIKNDILGQINSGFGSAKAKLAYVAGLKENKKFFPEELIASMPIDKLWRAYDVIWCGADMWEGDLIATSTHPKYVEYREKVLPYVAKWQKANCTFTSNGHWIETKEGASKDGDVRSNHPHKSNASALSGENRLYASNITSELASKLINDIEKSEIRTLPIIAYSAGLKETHGLTKDEAKKIIANLPFYALSDINNKFNLASDGLMRIDITTPLGKEFVEKIAPYRNKWLVSNGYSTDFTGSWKKNRQTHALSNFKGASDIIKASRNARLPPQVCLKQKSLA